MARLITARASVNLADFPVGSVAQVDPADPRTLALLRSGLLVSDEWWDDPETPVPEPRRPRPPRQPDSTTATPPPSEQGEEATDASESTGVEAHDAVTQTETPGPHAP